MTDETIKTRIHEKVKELVREVGKRDRANVRIIQLQSEIKALRAVNARNVLTTADEQLVGFTEGIRSVMRITGKAMTAAQVKDALSLVGYNFGNLSNPAAAVHSTLKRMADTGELHFDKESKSYKLRKPFKEIGLPSFGEG